ncbi:VCBS domain-containing protein [Vibrio sp. BS-M-Sm-2]|uniref:VCBS domain-containing protein n=2 Tax=Vibrio sp. BS-M-Sm-2 TaxID=3241167 RepID=UPI00390C78B5
MANKKNVETKKKNTELKDKNSHELKQKKPTQKKKLRLHSHLKVNIPLFQSLMMILPSLAKHAAAESIDNSSDSADQVTVNNVSEKDVTDDHSKAGSSAVVHQEAQTSDSDVNSTLSASHASHGSSAHLVPSHHLSTLSHPQVHYIPSVSMPTISSGSNSQPTHSNAPTTPALPVTFMPEVIKGTYGELHVDVNGQYTFVLNPNSPQYILLNQHQPGTDHFALHLSNGSSIIVQIPVTGKQDTPSISGDLTGVVTEDHNIDSQGLLHANGKIDVIDPDQNESSVTPEVISGKYGSLTIDADGHWQYQVDNSLSNVQALTAATSLHESFTIHTKDGTPQTIDMTIGGNNDNAVITGVDAGSVIEDLTTQVQGQLSVTDPDLGEDHFQASQVAGNFGTLIITKDGAWTYDLDNYSPYVQRLAQGSTATDIITVHSADGTAHQVTITINGTNDSAVITNSTGGSPNSFFVVGKSPHLDQVIEDHKLTVSGKLSISDIDAKEAHFSNTDVTGTLGTLHLKDNGAWAYDLDNTNPAVQALGKGATTTDTITVHSADGTPHQVTIIVNGTNDKAVIGGTNSGVVTEESQLQTSGTLTISDVDTGEAHFSNTDAVGALGTLHLKGNGAWTYDLDNTNPKVQALGKGATTTDTITIHSADGTPHQVTVTVNGTNDRPTISGTSSGAVIEQGLNTAGTPDATGSLTATDLDKSDTITWAINQPQGQWGTLSIDQNGHWHYQLDNSTSGAADKLAAGEHQSESFWITATDSAGATVPHKIVIDVQGSNDKPIVSAWTQLPAGKEDQPVTIKASDLLTHASDVDSSDVLHVTNLQATHGSLTDNKDGTYTFTPDKDFNGEIRLTYDVVDGHGGSVSTQAKFDLTATPDNAIITDAQTNADLRGVTEDRGYIDTQYQLHYDGRLNIQDPDAGEAQFDPNIGPQTYQGIGYDTKLGGHILLMRDGHYTYTLDNRNIQNLAQGEVKHDSVVIRSADGTTHTIELTVHGTNDVPNINAQSNSVTEGGSVLNGQMVGQDIDTGATLTYSAPQIDGLVVNPDGSYSFNPVHSSYQSLASGITKTLTVPVTVTDEHNASSTQNLSITITGVNNSAVISGVDTGDVHEGHTYTAPDGTMSGGYVDDRSPDHMHGSIGKIWNDEIHTDGHLNIIDPDSGESHAQTGTYQGTHGHVILQSNGDWSYYASIGQDATGRKIDHLGQGESITDTVTVKSADGTTHDIHITIHGDNDRPYCSSEVQLNSGKEDLAQTITTTELLANTVDVDTNDIGKLTIANLHADHGSIQDNTDGTYTFTPTKDYNGPVHFTYDVKDAHGGTTHTGANTTLVATPDKAIISEVTTGRVIEDGPHATHSNGTTTELANGQLQVIDPDSGEDKFQYSQFGESAVHDPFGGMLRIDSAGNWGYSVDNAALQHLAQGQVETVTYRVHSFDGTAYDLNIDIVGTNDAPTVTKVVLSNGTEDINYQMQASQFGFTDVDTGDTLHSIAITDLPPAAQGKFVLDGHDVTTGKQIPAANISRLQFVPSQDFNGDVQFKYTVNDGHTDSAEATNTLHIDAVGDKAVIAGVDTGDVYENRNPDMSPDFAQPGMAHLTNSMIHVEGQLTIIDPDTGENSFDSKGVGYTYHGKYGHLILNTDGKWFYGVATGTADVNGGLTKKVGSTIDQLGANETLTDTITIQSKDGTTHDIVITIHGDNDRPYCSSEVQLNSGKEDLAQTITATELLANTIDVDSNDLGKLTVANLLVDHGSVVDNKDGTYTFTPTKDYNGQVHFSYDVTDAHGGVTHTGASTTLAAVDDKTIISGVDHGVATEDIATHTSTNANIMDAVDWQALQVTDVDSPNTQVTVEFAGKQYTWNIGSNLDVTTPYGKFQFHTIASGSHKGEHSWSYIGDNNNVHVQELKHGESLTESIKLIATDGTEFPITVKVNGTEDGVVIDSKSELGHVVENAQTGASVSGSVIAHDVDLHDTVSWTQTPTTGISGQYGTFHLSTDGQWHYDVDQNKAKKLGDGDEYWEHFTVEAVSTDGSHVSKSVSVVVHGNNDAPTVSGEVILPSGKEDTSIHITQAELIANATNIDTNDRGWLHVQNLTADHGSLVSNSDGSFTFNPDPNYNGTVHFTYDVADRHGGIAHTGANTSLAAVNDVATFTGDSGSVDEDTSLHHNLHIAGATTIQDALTCNGHLIVSDADGQGEAALDLNGQHHLTQSGTYGQFVINSSGTWLYAADNNNVAIQDLDNGQTLTDHIEVTSKDGTKHSITVTINGTTDDPVLHSLSDSGVQHSGPIEGNLLTGSGTDQGLSGAATDTDSNAHLVLQDIQIKDPVSGYVAVRPGQPHTMTGIGTLAIEANGHYTFTPEAGFTGKVPSMIYRVGDDGGNPIGDSSQNSFSIEVTPPLQHAPTVTGQTVSTNEDITRTITTSEFGYSDQDGDVLQFVTITSIPSHGLLLLNGNAVTTNQQINKADLDAGHLTFTPINNENGANYAQFSFTANDGHQNSASATMIVDVNAVNDAPIVGSSFISSLEDKPHAFTTADFKYSDIDGDALNHITITNVAHGVLTLNGTTVNVGDDVSASDVSSLIFTPTHNYFSSGVSGLGAVQFTANDGHVDSKEGAILINIASVADPATFSGDSTGVAKEDITLQASGTLTASDPDGTAGFTAVQGGAGIAGSKGYGHAHIDVNGHWTYDLDNNHPIVQQLGEGQTDTETITVQSADGTHHDIVVTITGTNDAPILGVNQTSSTTGTLTEADVDVKDTHTFSVVGPTGQFGSLSVDPNTGDYVYTPNTSITGMSYNSATNTYHGVDVFEVKVSDGHTEDSKFITFDASGHVTMSPTGGLVISTTVPQPPTVTTTLPTLLMVTNVASTNSVTLDLASTSDSGSSNTDNLTNDTTPTITGHTDIPFSKVTIYDGSTPVGHTVSDASGQYSVAISSLSDGDHNLSAKSLAPSSMLPATSSLLSVHIDTQVHIGIQTDSITADNVINAQESNSSIDITGSVSGDYNAGDIVTLDVNGTQHTGVVDAKGHYSIAVPGSELIADADQKIEASIAVTDTAGNSAHATADVTYQVDTQVSVPTITFENAGADNLYSKAEIARGHANTITATVTPPGDAKIGEHLVVNGQDHVLDAHSLQHGIQIEVHPGSNIQATMTDEHGNTAGSQGFAASAIPEPIIVRPPSGSHQVSGTLGVPPLLPSLTPVPTAQSGWRIHLPNGQYVTSHHGQYGTLTIDPQTGHLHYQEQAQVHTGPHGSASGVGQHEDKFEVALQGTNQDEVVAHVNIQILSHGPGHSGKLTVGTEVVDMTITPIAHSSHPAPPPPPPVLHDKPDMASQADFTVTQSDDSYLDFTQHAHQEPDQKTDHHGAAAYLDALGIKPDATSTTVHDQPADMDIVLAQVDQQDTLDHDQAHLDMSDALEHHDANVNHHQDDEHHHHNDVDGLPDIDPNP